MTTEPPKLRTGIHRVSFRISEEMLRDSAIDALAHLRQRAEADLALAVGEMLSDGREYAVCVRSPYFYGRDELYSGRGGEAQEWRTEATVYLRRWQDAQVGEWVVREALSDEQGRNVTTAEGSEFRLRKGAWERIR